MESPGRAAGSKAMGDGTHLRVLCRNCELRGESATIGMWSKTIPLDFVGAAFWPSDEVVALPFYLWFA